MSAEEEYDTDRYSRQAYVLGKEAMRRIVHSSVVLVGLNGLGVEVAKNLVLSGISSLHVIDTRTVTFHDMAANFFTTPEDVGKSRVDVIIPKIRELNPSCKITVHDSFDSVRALPASVAIFCQVPEANDAQDQLTIDNSYLGDISDLPAKGWKIVLASATGLMYRIFCDFGDEFVVHDMDGREPSFVVVSGLTETREDNKRKVIVTTSEPHSLSSGDFVNVTDLQGEGDLLTAINETPEVEVQPISIDMLELILPEELSTADDSVPVAEYTRGGYLSQLKKPQTVTFKRYSEIVQNGVESIAPAQNQWNYFQEGTEAAAAFWSTVDTLGRIPKSVEELASIDDDVLAEKYVRASPGVISPMAAFVGGVAAQEVLKALTGKYGPLSQIMMADFMEVLPEDINEWPSADDCAPRQSRYDGQIAVLGHKFQEQIGGTKWFIVGAGALGCEYIKHFACTGICCGNDGELFITDNDNIEKSNLSRQFLFRSQHVGHAKADVAGNVGKAMNSDLSVSAFTEKVCPETEDKFNYKFYNQLDGVVNALDNMVARRYMDGRCVLFGLPLLEAGTLGTSANTQVVIPHVTESYSVSADPQDVGGIPQCTLHHFPTKIDHTIAWARDLFDGQYKMQPEAVNGYLTDSIDINDAASFEQLEMVADCGECVPRTFNDIVEMAVALFLKEFNHRERDLLAMFPLDSKNQDGNLFWSGSKRPPVPLEFDPKSNEDVADFIESTTRLLLEIYPSVVVPVDFDLSRENIIAAALAAKKPEYVQKEETVIVEEDEEEAQKETTGMKSVDELKARLPVKTALVPMNEIEFEKDDDTNFHVLWITAASNLRAANYDIPRADFQKTKQIAGRIIPAMITTTALITGLAGMEHFKMLRKVKKIDVYHNSFVNIAFPVFLYSEPLAPKKHKYIEEGEGSSESGYYTQWDAVDLRGCKNVGEIVESVKKWGKETADLGDIDVFSMTFGSAMIYSSFDAPQRMEEKKSVTIKGLMEKFCPDMDLEFLEVVALGEKEAGADIVDVSIPTIRVWTS